MSFNIVCLLDKEQLMTAIQKSGNEKILRILEDKNINGQELVELTESKMISWGLTSNQKKLLFAFINNLKLNTFKPSEEYISTNVFKFNEEDTKGISINSEVKSTKHNDNLPIKNIQGTNVEFLQELNSVLNRNRCLLSQPRPLTKPPEEDILENQKLSPSTPKKLGASIRDFVDEIYHVVCIPLLPIKQKSVRNHKDESNIGPDCPGECCEKKRKIHSPVLSHADIGKKSPKPSQPTSLPTRVYTKSLGEYLAEVACEPDSERKYITRTVDNKVIIEPDATGKSLSGNNNIAEILRDKNLNGQELLDLTELKIMNWRLTSNQKKELFTFINNLEVNPSHQMTKHTPTNLHKPDTDVSKNIPIKSMNPDLTQKTHSNPTIGSLPEIGISEKKATFVQELNSLLSSGHANPLNQSTTILKNIETDSNQARPSAKSQVSVSSSNQTPNTPKSLKDDETIISKYDHRTPSLSPLFSPKNSQFHQKDSMNLLFSTAQPLQNGYRRSPQPNRKPLPPRPGLAKSTGDLVNGWDQAVSATPVPFQQKFAKKISDHGDTLNKSPDGIGEYSKKEIGNFSQPILNQMSDAESFFGTNLPKLPPNAFHVPSEVNRKPISLPLREIVQPPVQFLDQAVSTPTSSSNQRFMKQVNENKNTFEPGSTGKHKKKGTGKTSLPPVSQITSPKGSFGPSFPQSPENVSSVHPEHNRKPIPLPTRGLPQPPVQCLDQPVCPPLPSSRKKIIKHAKENKYSIEQDANGKYLESHELQEKEEPSPSKFADPKEEGDSTTKSSTFYIPLEKNTSQGTAYWVPHLTDDDGYLEILQHPVDKNSVPTHPNEYEVERKSQRRNEFQLDLSKALKEKVVQKNVKQFIEQDHSHLSSIITPPSSADELFEEDQEEKYTIKSISINEITKCNEVAFRQLPRPPTRMVTPEFIDEDGYFEIVKHDGIRLDNLRNDHYYMQIRGKETKRMLSLQENGSFLFRPGRKYFLVLTIKHDGKLYNFRIDLADDGKIHLNGKSGSALGGFSSLSDFVNYFCCEPITFMDGEYQIEIYMNPFLGPDSFQCCNN